MDHHGGRITAPEMGAHHVPFDINGITFQLTRVQHPCMDAPLPEITPVALEFGQECLPLVNKSQGNGSGGHFVQGLGKSRAGINK